MKTATVTVRVEDELRQRFNEAAARAHVPGAQIIRNFMRNFADNPPAPAPVYGGFERSRAVEFAVGNSELEGYKTPPALKELLERYAKGEITIEDAIRKNLEATARFLTATAD